MQQPRNPGLSGLALLAAELDIVEQPTRSVCKHMKASLRPVVPLIASGGSLADAVAFYTEHMGFSVVWKSGGMAGITRPRRPR